MSAVRVGEQENESSNRITAEALARIAAFEVEWRCRKFTGEDGDLGIIATAGGMPLFSRDLLLLLNAAAVTL